MIDKINVLFVDMYINQEDVQLMVKHVLNVKRRTTLLRCVKPEANQFMK